MFVHDLSARFYEFVGLVEKKLKMEIKKGEKNTTREHFFMNEISMKAQALKSFFKLTIWQLNGLWHVMEEISWCLHHRSTDYLT